MGSPLRASFFDAFETKGEICFSNQHGRKINATDARNEKTNLKLNLDEDESTQNKDINEDKNNITTEFKQEEDEDLNNFLKRSKTAIIKFDQKQKELEEKRIKKLQILFFKVDRINMKIIRNVFQKYNLRSKLESISIIEGGKKKKNHF